MIDVCGGAPCVPCNLTGVHARRRRLPRGSCSSCAALAAFLLLRGDDPPSYSPLEIEGDPYAYESGREDEFERRAAAGHSHVVYAKSPGGVVATARARGRSGDLEKEAAEAGSTRT